MLLQNLSREHIGQPAERADGNGLLLEVVKVFDIGSDDEAVS